MEQESIVFLLEKKIKIKTGRVSAPWKSQPASGEQSVDHYANDDERDVV